MNIAGKSMIAGLALLATTFAGGAVAGAQDDSDAYVGAQPEVLSETLTPDAPAAPAAEGGASASAAEVQGTSLAFTGGDALALSLVGGAAVVGGAGILAARRRSTS